MYNFGISEHVEWFLLAEGSCDVFLIRGVVATRAHGLRKYTCSGVLTDIN